MKQIIKKWGCLLIVVLMLLSILSGCSMELGQESGGTTPIDGIYQGSGGGETIRILSGSENKELGEILEQCAKETGVTIEMTYKGSVDIMTELQSGAADYDAVWPASGLWLSLGDTNHLIKYDESISTTPVVFGIKQSLAEKLGFVGKDVSVSDILTAIESGKLSFCMTSATQSNSGASAYIGFLYALLGKSEGLTEADLDDPELKEKITGLLSGIDRSSGSSDWLKEMFLAGDFDAMVNYECLIIDANNTLVEQGKEPLYVVYPYDGLSIADSPLGYVDHGDAKKQEAFLQIQEYLLSEEVQNEIQKTGRRTGFEGVAEENKVYFPSEWGINVDKVLSPISMPSEPVLMKALNLYQTSFRKPSLNMYCLDYSGSMQGEGNAQLVEAMAQVLLQENAEQNLLQAEQEEINIIIAFDDEVISTYMCEGNNAEKLEELYQVVAAEEPGGGTDMYIAAEEALWQISQISNLEDYTPAIILMTDGASETGHKEEFIQQYKELGKDIPIFSIMFGSAEPEQLEELAELTNARVFDGSKDLVAAFRSVKGYN
ncbi:MAG: VWA domain-containing protein [Lachnospiraceae bacterium]|nr:VWA domain-containing protein [Lachnospiraceae bacterium]